MSKRPLRSREWFGRNDFNGFVHRAWLKNQGWPQDLFDGRPAIGICNTWSELTPCNAHFREIAESVKRGVWEAGGFPLEFPVMSLGEPLMRPTAMLFRNLVSMDVEESIRANPIDGVVLLMGCDKTTPALLMGAASCDLPTIGISGGPMLSGRMRGKPLGSGTGVWQMSEELRGGRLTQDEFHLAERCMNRSKGHCTTMGTASTMACLVEAMGMALPGNATFPAVDAGRYTLAQLSGRRIVEMVQEDLRMSRVLTRASLENAIRVTAAIGGSTNAVLHLIALARRLSIDLTLADWDRLGASVPCLVNLQPAGQFLMEDFHYAGGLPVVLAELAAASLLDGMAPTVSGEPLKKHFAAAECYNPEVIRTCAEPFKNRAGIAVLYGNLAPSGAVIKPAAASAALLRHRGRALVFENIEDFTARIDDESLEVEESSVLVLKNCGPRGYPGMPEVGNLRLPARLVRRGIKDMVRISDARMSGTAYGTVVLHVAPEAAVGGTLGLVETGDWIELDVDARRLSLEVDDDVLNKRRATWSAPPVPARGYAKLYADHVLQADLGVDLDFLVGGGGSVVARDSH